MINDLKNIKEELQKIQDPEKARILSGFFKAGKGQYGEGDVFLGIKVPVQRKFAQKYSGIPLDDVCELMKSNIHVSEILISDEHDLIQKAVGWMLREIGKRDLKVEEEFLQKHYRKMPGTMLRYAIKKFDGE